MPFAEGKHQDWDWCDLDSVDDESPESRVGVNVQRMALVPNVIPAQVRQKRVEKQDERSPDGVRQQRPSSHTASGLPI